MINKKILFIPLVLMSMTLAGCASTNKRQVNLNLKYMTANSAPADSNQNASNQIAQAAGSVDRSLSQLSAVQLATHPRVRMRSPSNAAGMSRVVSLSWNGPVESLISRIAAKAHYRLSVIGTKPAIPVLVNVQARNQTLSQILRNVTYQVSAKARVVVYSRNRIIELRYKGR